MEISNQRSVISLIESNRWNLQSWVERTRKKTGAPNQNNNKKTNHKINAFVLNVKEIPLLSERHNTMERRLGKLHGYGFNAYTDLIRSPKEIFVC
jgi:hypothetical protein